MEGGDEEVTLGAAGAWLEICSSLGIISDITEVFLAAST